MENYPEVFNIFFISLIRTGEASGRISESLAYLSDHLEREHDISAQIKNALIYPAFVIIVLFIVVGLVMFFVMPRMMDLIKQTAVDPPPFTKLMISFYGFLASYGWVLGVAFICLVLFAIYYMTTKEGKKIWNKLSLKIPFFGDFLKKTFLIMFAENISTLIAAGLSINNALEITRDTVDNSVYKEILTETGQRVSEGEKISSVFVKYPDLVPPFVVQMIQVGEETGKLDRNLLEIVNFYNKEVKRAVELFTAMLEPVLIIFLGAFVAILAISVIQPLYGTLGAI
jgi:type II secretory pathway component PulF